MKTIVPFVVFALFANWCGYASPDIGFLNEVLLKRQTALGEKLTMDSSTRIKVVYYIEDNNRLISRIDSYEYDSDALTRNVPNNIHLYDGEKCTDIVTTLAKGIRYPLKPVYDAKYTPITGVIPLNEGDVEIRKNEYEDSNYEYITITFSDKFLERLHHENANTEYLQIGLFRGTDSLQFPLGRHAHFLINKIEKTIYFGKVTNSPEAPPPDSVPLSVSYLNKEAIEAANQELAHYSIEEFSTSEPAIRRLSELHIEVLDKIYGGKD